MKNWILAIIAMVLFVAPVLAGTRVVAKKSMSFENCLRMIRNVSGKLGVAPVNVVETNILRIVRFKTDDGSGKSVLVTCSKLDQKMMMNESW